MGARRFDVAVIGGGVGGYPAAVALAGLGFRVALFEEALLGGECVNWGCVPSKALLHAARVVWESRRLGLRVERPDRGWPWGWVARVVDGVRGGVESLLESAGVEVVVARAKIAGRVSGGFRVEAGGDVYEADRVVAAPGSEPVWPPWAPRASGVVDNRGFYSLREAPDRVVIVGAGPVGVEAAFALAWLGSRVTLVEARERVLPSLDRDLSAMAARGLRRAGVRVVTRASVRLEAASGGGVMAVLPDGREQYDLALLAVGRRPRTRGLGLEEAGARLTGAGFVDAGPGMEAAPGLYVAGDAAGPPMLAHKAIQESLRAAAVVAGLEAPRGRPTAPIVVYGDPEVASVGLTLQEALDAGIPAGEARFNLAGLAKARIENDGLGLVKVVYRRDNGAILGFHVAAPNAAEAIAAALEALESGARVSDAAWRARPHPTVVEALSDALLEAMGIQVHRVRLRGRKGSA